MSATVKQPIAAARAGDREAFMILFEQQLNALYRFVARELRYRERIGHLLPGEVSPTEIVDEVAVRALRRVTRMPRRATFKGWLRLLALRAIDDAVRRSRLRRHMEAVSLETPLRTGQRADVYYQPDAALTWADVLPDPGPSPEERVVLRETWDTLEQALNNLPADQRMVFVLRAIEGLGYEEIAAIIHKPRSAVKSMYYAAREVLRERFAGQLHAIEAA